MATVKEALRAKSAHVYTVSGDATVYEAAQLMNQHRIGALVVLSPDGAVTGIFTERDALTRVMGQKRDPEKTRIREVMTTPVVCCQLETELDEARAVFRNRRIRHLPVLGDHGELEGMLSIGDVNAYRVDAQELTILYMHDYLYGRI